jgi:hypothetical protein
MLYMLSNSAVTGLSSVAHRFALIALFGLMVACGGGGPNIEVDDPAQSTEPQDNADNSSGTDTDTDADTDTNSGADTDTAGDNNSSDNQQPEVITVPYDSARAGSIDGVNIWQMPDAPDGSRPDQSWLAVGSDANGEIYISGHDHQTNSMLYRMYQHDNTLRWVGDAKTASEAANNWQTNESAEKFHTRPIDHNGTVYVATLDSSDMNYSYQNTRGFHWYGYQPAENSFTDLSATEPNGVGAEQLQIVSIQKDPVNNLLYGMSIPENKLVRYDIATGTTTVLGKPSAWQNFFYSNRFMWVDSRGRVYITGGSSRNQWNQGEPASVFDHVWYYDPQTGFGELPAFSLQGPNAMEVGQWDRIGENLYTSDDQGNIYKFNDAAASWQFIGRPDFSSSLKTWVFQLSADGEKIYIGLSDGARDNAIYEYDIASGSSYELMVINQLDPTAGAENFITGYDSWDSRGSFYISDFSMYDGDNAYMMGINPVRIKAAKGLLDELVEVSVQSSDSDISIARSGIAMDSLDVLYEIRGYNSSGDWVATSHGEITLAANQTSLTLDPSSLSQPTGSTVASTQLWIIADGNDYIVAEQRNIEW